MGGGLEWRSDGIKNASKLENKDTIGPPSLVQGLGELCFQPESSFSLLSGPPFVKHGSLD